VRRLGVAQENFNTSATHPKGRLNPPNFSSAASFPLCFSGFNTHAESVISQNIQQKSSYMG
jgi:hypothetical protein